MLAKSQRLRYDRTKVLDCGPTAGKGGRGMAHILIVDDDRAIRDMMACALECEGYEVTTLSDGSRVLEVLAALHAPHLVLLDLMMPRVDGWAVCRALEAEPALVAPHTVICMTAAQLPEGALPAPACAV